MSDDTVREAQFHDIPALVHGRIRMFEDMAAHAGSVFDPDLSRRIESESDALFRDGWGTDHVGWVCEHRVSPDEPIVVGSAMITLQPWLPHPRYPSGVRAYVHSVHVDPAHRGRGIATMLTEAAIAWSRGQGFTHVVLHASAQGRPIYERLGFTNSSEWILPIAED